MLKAKIAAALLVAGCVSPWSWAAAAASRNPCALPEAKQFDFWVGDWDLTWTDGKGTNTITRGFDDCVILENFSAGDSNHLRGMSLSVWNAQLGKWRQTWVDNEAGYLDFSGGFKDGRMVLERKAILDGKEVLQRMIWHDIKKDSLQWNWERSEDNGATWKVIWRIDYRRRAPQSRS